MSDPVVLSFNGFDLQTGGRFGHFSRQGRVEDRASEPVSVDVAGRFPVLVRTQPQPRTIPVHVLIESGALEAQITTLMETFAVGTAGELKVDYEGTTRVLDATVINALPRDGMPQRFTAVLAVPDARWREETVNLEVDTITVSGQTFAITNVGNAREDLAVFRVRPSDLKETGESWPYYTECVIANRIDRAFSAYAFDITDGGWDHAAEVTAVRSQADGDDIRVPVDGVIVPHWATGLNTSSAKIWINLDLSPSAEVTLATAMTALAPANGGTIDLETDDADVLKPSGLILFDDELIRFSDKDRSEVSGITRAVRGTTAAIHSVGTVGYLVERRVQLMFGYSAATAPTARDELKPLIDLVNSTNTTHVWPDFAHETEPRSMQWSRAQVARDGQVARILLPSGEPLVAAVFEYQEDGAESGKPPFNTLRRRFPSGLANGGGGNALSFTRAIDDTLALKTIGRDDEGNEDELSSEPGPIASGALNIAEPAEPVFDVDLYVRSTVFDGSPPGASELGIAMPTVFDDTAQQFTSSEDVEIIGWMAKVGGVSGRLIDSQLMTDEVDTPGTAIAAAGQITTDTGGAGRLYSMLLSAPVQLISGQKYWISFHANAADANLRHIAQMFDELLEDSSVAQASRVAIHRLLSLDAVTATIRAIGTSGDQVTVDALTATLDSAKVPYVNQLARADGYWLDGVLSSQTTGQSLTFAILCALNDDIEIDMAKGVASARNITADEPAGYGVTASDPDNGIYFEPGVNTLDWTEAGLDQVVIDTDHFGRWE